MENISKEVESNDIKIDKFFESYFRNLLFKKMIDDSQNFSSQF